METYVIGKEYKISESGKSLEQTSNNELLELSTDNGTEISQSGTEIGISNDRWVRS